MIRKKTCVRCKIIIPFNDFYPSAYNPDGRDRYCKPCHSARAKEFKVKNPELHYLRLQKYAATNREKRKAAPHQFREYDLKKIYGITMSEYQAMVEEQQSRCWICGEVPRKERWDTKLHIDHSHKTGKIRKLLCGACNRGLGDFGENLERMRKAIEYLSLYGDQSLP